ncbi:P-loop containing nucleoside triphosphate hydrolase protein, partial [Ochromonadaceae sp. CCMP2298]
DKGKGTFVAGTEAGGITQKLSAFGSSSSGAEKKRVMFLDTPGHAAFSAMRSHGAGATDMVVLVVALDDGVRPQTVEALRMAMQARCSVVVVLNKVDKIPKEDRPEKRKKVRTGLLELGLVAEEFGGEAQVVEVAGRTGEGLRELVEALLLQAELL